MREPASLLEVYSIVCPISKNVCADGRGDATLDIRWLTEYAVQAVLGEAMDETTFRRVTDLVAAIEARPFPRMREAVPAYCTVTVYFPPLSDRERGAVEAWLRERMRDASAARGGEPRVRIVDIPVEYGGECGPDLAFVAAHNGIREEDVIRIHCSRTYPVHMIGFLPGFPYLGRVSDRIAAPRKSVPRPLVPAGSVGIAGNQTGIYPTPSPGGWQIIGRTPLVLFDPNREPPNLLSPGDRVRFVPMRPQHGSAT